MQIIKVLKHVPVLWLTIFVSAAVNLSPCLKILWVYV
jgi:hypothetical protein